MHAHTRTHTYTVVLMPPPSKPVSATTAAAAPKAAAATKAAAAAAPLPQTNTAAFSAFVLSRIASHPLLIHETPRSLASADTGSGVPSSLDAAQRALLGSADAASSGKLPATSGLNSASSSSSSSNTSAALTGLLQRALVDAPLLPNGGAHLLHELVSTPFMACAEAAKQVGCFRQALELQASATRTSSGDAETTAAAAAGNAMVEGKAVEGTFEASPLASSPTAEAPPSSALGNDGSAVNEARVTAAELSVSVTADVLRARLAQAETRLAEQKALLQRGLAKLRRTAQALQEVDAVAMSELRRRRQAAVRELLTPVTVAGPLKSTVNASVTASTAAAEQDRKRQRTCE